MPGRKPLRKMQFARETTPGTAVTAATAIWRGEAETIEDTREVKMIPEHIGIFGGGDRSHIEHFGAGLKIPDTPATFEQLPYLNVMGWGGPFTGVADGAASSGFKYVTTIPTTAVPTNTAYTVQTGDDYEAEYMEYAKCIAYTLKGTAGGDVRMGASLIGKQVTRHPSGLTASVAIPSVEDALFGMAKLYLDPVAGPIGTTQITSQFLGFEITFKAMWVPKFTGDGTLAWSLAVYADKEITGKITLEHDAASDGNTGIKSHLRAQTPRLLRIDIIGAAYGTPGTGTIFTGGKKGIRIDLPVKWTKVPPLGDMNSNDTITAEFSSRYNTTYASAGAITVCNEVSALP